MTISPLSTRFKALCMLAGLCMAFTVQAVSLRVGVYQNQPGVFITEGGQVTGFYIDVLEYVAKQEGWQLDYRQDTWSGLMEGLADGRIDLVAGMAYTQERDRRYDFTQEPLFVNWGQVYTDNTAIQSLLDLKGLRVIGLKDDIYALSFRDLLSQFDLGVEFGFVDSYREVLLEVEAGRADAGITSRSNGEQLASQFDVVRSPILCCSQEIGYAAREGEQQAVLATLDRHLRQLKADKNSYYFSALDRWYGFDAEKPLPEWVFTVIAVLAAGAFLLLAGVLLLNHKVRERTRRLQEAHSQLEERVRQRTEDLYTSNRQLRDEISEHHKTQGKLLYLASHDSLTGLPNRRWFSDRLDESIKRARRAERTLAVLFMDLNGFKMINDTHGHDLGDQVLVQAALRLRESLREVDQIARLGGDEFIVLLPELENDDSATVVAEKIIALFGDPFVVGDKELNLGVSIGISIYPEHGDEGETLLRHADIAMYEAKHRRQAHYCHYHPDLSLENRR